MMFKRISKAGKETISVIRIKVFGYMINQSAIIAFFVIYMDIYTR